MKTGRKMYRSWSFGRFMQGDRPGENIPEDLSRMYKSIEGERKIKNMLLNILCKFLSLGPSLQDKKYTFLSKAEEAC